MEKENEMEDIRLTPEESWPAMEQQLDRYYALKRRKRIAWYLMSVALLGTIVGYWYFKSPSVPASMVGSIDMIPLRETAAVNPIAVRPPASNTLQSALPGQKESTAAVFADQPESSNERANHRDASVGTGRSRQSEWSSPSPESQVDRSTGEQTMLRTDAAVSSTGTASSEADNKISDVASGNTAAARSAAESPASEGPAIVESALIVDAPVGKRTIEPMSEAGTAEVHPVVDFAASPSSPGDSSMVKSVETQALAPWSVAATPQIRKDTARRSSGSGSSGSLEIAYGRYIRSRTLSSDDAAWDQRRMDEEEIRIPQSFTVLYSRQVGKWSMGAGFEFWELGESTYYTGSVAYDSILDNSYYTYQVDSLDTLYLSGNQLILRDASPDVLDSVYNLQFDTVNGTAVDPSLVTRNGIVSWSLVQVPVRFGYTVGSGKLSLAGQVSVAPGILTGFRGQYLDASQSRLVSAGELAPVRRFQLAANVGFRLEYRFGGAWSVLAGPDWRRQFTSMYRKESAIDQRYSPWGISAGVKCRLGGN